MIAYEFLTIVSNVKLIAVTAYRKLIFSLQRIGFTAAIYKQLSIFLTIFSTGYKNYLNDLNKMLIYKQGRALDTSKLIERQTL